MRVRTFGISDKSFVKVWQIGENLEEVISLLSVLKGRRLPRDQIIRRARHMRKYGILLKPIKAETIL
jgi:hypothetical protein